MTKSSKTLTRQVKKTSRKKTSMKKFGTSARSSHDSNSFYSRRLYSKKTKTDDDDEFENPLGKFKNTVLHKDSSNLSKIPSQSVHLMVTSPPYNVGKDYDDDLNLREYFTLLDGVFAETHRVLISGGRACINIANVGRKPYIPYHKYIIESMQKNGFLMRGEIIWQKGAGAGSSTAWGSWKSASNPVLRDTHEYILVFSKNKFDRKKQDRKNTISRDQFIEYTKSIWKFNPEKAKKVNHPAPFPVELPYRCIQLYTFEGDIIFDPFCGSGTTAIAALKSKRGFLLVDKNKKYVKIAKDRIKNFVV